MLSKRKFISPFVAVLFCLSVASTASDTFYVPVHGVGEKSVLPDRISATVTAEASCESSESAAIVQWNNVLKALHKQVAKLVAENKKGQLVQSDAGPFKKKRYREGRRYNQREAGKIFDTCLKDEDGNDLEVKDIDVFLSADFTKFKAGWNPDVWQVAGDVVIQTTRDQNRQLDDALETLKGAELKKFYIEHFKSVKAGVRVVPPQRRDLHQASLSPSLLEQTRLEATLAADKNANGLRSVLFDSEKGILAKAGIIETGEKAKVEHVNGASVNVETSYLLPSRQLHQIAGVEFTLASDYDNKNKTLGEEVVTVASSAHVTTDYYEVSVKINGFCFASEEMALLARQTLASSIDKHLLNKDDENAYSKKTPTKGVDHQRKPIKEVNLDDADSPFRKVFGKRAFLKHRCVLPKGADMILESSVDKELKRWYSFEEVLVFKDPKPKLLERLMAHQVFNTIQKNHSSNFSLEFSRESEKRLTLKENGENRTKAYSALTSEKITKAICDKLSDAENAGQSGKVVACRLIDQTQAWQPRPRPEDPSRRSAQREHVQFDAGPGGPDVDTGQLEKLIPVRMTTILKVPVHAPREYNK